MLEIAPALFTWASTVLVSNAQSCVSWISFAWEDEALDRLYLHVTSRLISG